MSEIKIGTRLKAINPCKMDGSKTNTLTVGKSYKVIDIIKTQESPQDVVIIDDDKTNHYFPINGIWDWFEVKISKNTK